MAFKKYINIFYWFLQLKELLFYLRCIEESHYGGHSEQEHLVLASCSCTLHLGDASFFLPGAVRCSTEVMGKDNSMFISIFFSSV